MAGPLTLIGWAAVPDFVIWRAALYVPGIRNRVFPAARFFAPVVIEQGAAWVQLVPLPVLDT
jgi:hypothetical protein